MNDKRDKELVRSAVDTCFSDLKGNPWMAQHIMNGVGKEQRMKKKISFGLVFVMVLALSTVAVAAALHWGVLEQLIGGDIQNEDAVMQGELHQETVNGVVIRIKEAGYDGKTLWLTTSYTLPDVSEPFGDCGNGGVPGEWDDLLHAHHVGWWMDSMWINGQEVNMPGDSYSTMNGSDVSGELLVYEAWRLDNEGITLHGQTEIALPIGDTQSILDYARADHPECYTDDGTMRVPDQGIVAFTFTSDMVNVRTEHPCVKAELPLVTAQVSEVFYSPIMTYVTLGLEVNSDAMAAYVKEHGESVTLTDPGNGQSFDYTFSGMDVYDAWLSSLVLVDGDGQEVFTDMPSGRGYGLTGWGDAGAEILLPYRESWPDEMYLAPIDGDAADMSLAVKVK